MGSDFTYSRRQVLRLMGIGSLYYGARNPIDMIARCLTDGLISEAQAQSGPPPARYINIQLPGAVPNWIYGFITPGNQSVMPNASMKNSLNTDNYNPSNPGNTAWRSTLLQVGNGKTVYGSPLWNALIPTSNGAVVYARNLLQNMASYRGIDYLADVGHVMGPARTIMPLGASGSLTGLNADANSDFPLAAVGCKGVVNYADEQYGGYKSLKGISPTLINSSNNALASALSPFVVTDSGSLALSNKLNSTLVRQATRAAMTELGAYAKSQNPGAAVLYNNRTNAEKLFDGAFGNLNATYATLVNKYENILANCAATHIPFVLPATGSAPFNRMSSYSKEFAYQMAVTEYLLTTDFNGKKGFTASVSLCSDGGAAFAGLNVNNDEHTESDRQASIICQSWAWFSLLAVLNELIRVLKANNLFAETVISIGCEFGRNPRNDGTGSDHDSRAGQYTIISGRIPSSMGPIISGNIYTDSVQAGYAAPYTGTWGVNAPTVTDFGTVSLTTNHMAATTAALLGFPSPVNAPSLLSVDSSGMVTGNLCAPPQNV